MKRPLTVYAREYLVNGERALAKVDCPVLLWEVGERTGEGEVEPVPTISEAAPVENPRPGNPLVVLLKGQSTQTKGVSLSIGRGETNDVVLENASVSRLHALIHREPRTGAWRIADAGSRNGTCVNGVRLEREKEVPLEDGAVVKLGDAQLKFLLAQSFFRYVAERVNEVS